MKRIFLIVIYFIFCTYVFSQACGSGKFTIEFFTKQKEDLEYEIFEIDKEKINNLNTLDLYYGSVLQDSIIKNINLYTIDKSQLPMLTLKSLKTKGKIVNNELIFTTFESFNRIYALKINDELNKIYLIGNLLGGCSRSLKIVVTNEPILIKN
jgi:hypothetical protein